MPNGTCSTQRRQNVHPLWEKPVRHMKLLEQTNLLEAPSPEPRVTIQIIETGHIQLVLRFPAPDRGRSRIEQSHPTPVSHRGCDSDQQAEH